MTSKVEVLASMEVTVSYTTVNKKHKSTKLMLVDGVLEKPHYTAEITDRSEKAECKKALNKP